MSATVGTTELEDAYADMLRIRRFEDAVHRLFLSGEIEGTTHLCQGQEAVSVGVARALDHGSDIVAATYRGHGACLAMGVDPEALFAELLGRAAGVCGGRAGSMNLVDLEHRVLGCFAIVGGSIGAATGAGMSAQARRHGGIAAAFFGDGATNQAYFHECLNLAAVRRLPVLYVCENNLYGEWTPMAAVTAGADIAARAGAYGMPGVAVDGNDVEAVLAAARTAVARARAGEGPTLLECRTYRHKGHSRTDPARYRPADELEAWLARDPLTLVAGVLESRQRAEIDAAVTAEIDAALRAARETPLPDPVAMLESTACPS